MTKFWQQSTSLESRGSPEVLDRFLHFYNGSFWRKRIYKNAYSQRSGCYLSSTFPFAFILTIRPPKSSGEKLTRIAIVCVLELSTVPVSFFRMRRMSLALSPQLWMSSLMSVSVMCWARPRTIMVLLGGTLRASSSLLKKNLSRGVLPEILRRGPYAVVDKRCEDTTLDPSSKKPLKWYQTWTLVSTK